MSLVPVTGPARLLVGEPPREGSVEFTDERRTIVMPIRGALPVLGKVRDQPDVHPSVAMLAGAALMGLQLVASGRFAPDPEGRHWQVPPSSSLPHPVQRPHPPLLVGGASAAAQRRAYQDIGRNLGLPGAIAGQALAVGPELDELAVAALNPGGQVEDRRIDVVAAIAPQRGAGERRQSDACRAALGHHWLRARMKR